MQICFSNTENELEGYEREPPFMASYALIIDDTLKRPFVRTYYSVSF